MTRRVKTKLTFTECRAITESTRHIHLFKWYIIYFQILPTINPSLLTYLFRFYHWLISSLYSWSLLEGDAPLVGHVGLTVAKLNINPQCFS